MSYEKCTEIAISDLVSQVRHFRKPAPLLDREPFFLRLSCNLRKPLWMLALLAATTLKQAYSWLCGDRSEHIEAFRSIWKHIGENGLFPISTGAYLRVRWFVVNRKHIVRYWKRRKSRVDDLRATEGHKEILKNLTFISDLMYTEKLKRRCL